MYFKNRFKPLIALLVIVFTLSAGVLSSFADTYVMSWNLVDSGKHLDYDGDTKYMNYVVTGASIWNNYKRGVIRRDGALSVRDVYISDVSVSDNTLGVTSKNGTIELNAYYLDDCTESQKTNTVAHELGHALGLDHTPSIRNIMYEAQTTMTGLGQDDKDSYDLAYSRY